MSVTYLSLEDLLHVAERVLGEVQVRDLGLLASAAERPRTTVFGEDAYPSVLEKGAALLQSIVRNHPLIDGNKRLGLAALLGFLGVNGLRLTLDNDGAYDLVVDVATGDVVEVAQIATRLAAATEPR